MFNSKLAKIAAKILANGKYTPLDDIIKNYPNGVKVNGFTVKAAKSVDNAYAFNFDATAPTATAPDAGNPDAGNPDALPYFFAESGDLKKLVDAWLDEMTVDEIDTALAENPITLRIYKITTRNNRPYVKAHIVDDNPDAAQG